MDMPVGFLDTVGVCQHGYGQSLDSLAFVKVYNLQEGLKFTFRIVILSTTVRKNRKRLKTFHQSYRYDGTKPP